ncbi:MAG TPA: hypothetical protein PK988_12140, partial [Candidatus Sumerlaeota bacterium]|nr:hypothetical protein [Candidatus Sumerlaeota bacterium]
MYRSVSILRTLLALALGAFMAIGSAAFAQTCSPAITVSSADDSGTGTLRQALQDICPSGTITFDGSLNGAT